MIRKSLILVAVLAVGAFATTASATHAWGNYHWGRTANPLPLQLGDNVTSTWDASLLLARDDWNVSTVLETTVNTGRTTARQCKPTAGRGEVCNSKYGNNGWLGIAQIWINGDHITQGVVKLNDTYFNTATYNTSAWRNLVMCQEIGHIFGLGHQDENFSNANLGTCMDYTNLPTSNQHPNAHDYSMLEQIYSHLDATNTYILYSGSDTGVPGNGKGNGGMNDVPFADIDLENPAEWGKKVGSHLYERDFGNGKKVLTDVIWVEGREHGNDK